MLGQSLPRVVGNVPTFEEVLRKDPLGLNFKNSGKCSLRSVKISDISHSFSVLVWSMGDGAPEEGEKPDNSQKSVLFIEKPKGGSISVGKCQNSYL